MMKEEFTNTELELCELLGFSDSWIDLGVVDHRFLALALAKWMAGEDAHAEHYRYWAFQEFVRARRPLSPELASALYELGKSDSDESMGGALMLEIIELPECPQAVRDSAAASDRHHLVRAVERMRDNEFNSR